MISHPSPNFDDRAVGTEVTLLVLHYTGMASGAAALERLCDGAAKVSAHYMIEEDGQVYCLVNEDKRAWHAGVSSWEGQRDINSLSIGIELVNPGHDGEDYKGNYRAFPEGQMAALIPLCQDIVSRHNIRPWHILGHSDVAPARKIDPGELFDWQRLSGEGIGIWPAVEKKLPASEDVADIQKKLAEYGYDIAPTGIYDDQTRAVVSAFQRHFRPTNYSGTIDQQTAMILDHLLAVKSA